MSYRENEQIPLIPDTVTSVSTSTTATDEQGGGLGGIYWFRALSQTAYITFGATGAVVTPTASNGFPLLTADEWFAVRVGAGKKFRVLGAGSGSLIWFYNPEG